MDLCNCDGMGGNCGLCTVQGGLSESERSQSIIRRSTEGICRGRGSQSSSSSVRVQRSEN